MSMQGLATMGQIEAGFALLARAEANGLLSHFDIVKVYYKKTILVGQPSIFLIKSFSPHEPVFLVLCWVWSVQKRRDGTGGFAQGVWRVGTVQGRNFFPAPAVRWRCRRGAAARRRRPVPGRPRQVWRLPGRRSPIPSASHNIWPGQSLFSKRNG